MNAFATPEEVDGWLDASDYVGDAPQRTQAMARSLRETVATPRPEV